jgi:predicted dehydrogenase
MKPLRAAVLGVGVMGRSHARIYAEMAGVDLVGVVDPDASACDRVARTYGVKAYADHSELLERERPDLVSVAVPTVAHAEVALEAIGRGIHVLVEKPIAFSMEEGRQIIDAAESQGVKLAVGHIERFNPAVVEIKRRLGEQELGRIFQVHARRLSPFTGRVQDVGVTLDLATHDIDVMCHLLDAEVTRVFAETERKAHEIHEDLLSALLRFSNGTIGVLDVNSLTPTKVRQLAVLGEGGLYLADYLTQDVYWHTNKGAGGDWDMMRVFRGAWEGDMVKLHFAKHEPLLGELQAFVTAVVEDLEPQAGGLDALAAIELSNTLVESGRDHVPLAPRPLRAQTS